MAPESSQLKGAGNSSEHETNTGALVFLVVLMIVVSAVTLSMAHPQSGGDSSHSANQADTPRMQQLQKAAPSVLSSMPQNMPNPDVLRIVELINDKNGQNSQSIVRFETPHTINKLFTDYEEWMQGAGYRVAETNQKPGSATLIAGNGSEQLFVTMADMAEYRRVELNFVRL